MADRLLQGPGLAVPVALVAAPVALLSALAPVWALVGLAAVLVLLLVVARAEILLLVLVAVLPWEGALMYPSETVSVVKLLGLLLFLAWALRAAARNDTLQLPPTLLPVVVFAIAVFLSLAMSPDAAVGIRKTLSYALFFAFFFLVLQLARERDDVKRAVRVISLSAAAASAYALYLFLFVGEIDRASGPIQDPNDFAYIVASVLPLVGYLLASEPARRPLWALCFLLLCAATLATLSRGALVGLGALAVWAVVTRRVAFTGVLLAIGTLVSVALLAFALWAPLIEDRLDMKGRVAVSNVGSRQALWVGALEMAADRPLTGVGPDAFAERAPDYVRNNPIILERPVVHNSYLEILAESGPLALLAFVAFLGGTWRVLGSAARRAAAARDDDLRRLTTALQGTMVIAIVSAIFLSEQLTTPFWLIGALAAVVAGVPRPGPRPARGAGPAGVPA